MPSSKHHSKNHTKLKRKQDQKDSNVTRKSKDVKKTSKHDEEPALIQYDRRVKSEYVADEQTESPELEEFKKVGITILTKQHIEI